MHDDTSQGELSASAAFRTKPVVRLFGFSISEQSNGYAERVRVQCDASDSPYDFDYKAIGGATFNLIPYLFEHLGLEGADYVILEISSCVRFSKTRDGYVKTLEEIAGLCQASGAIPCFIQLYRRAVDYADDPLTEAIQTFASDNGLPCLDLFSTMVEQRDKGTLLTYLRDGTHTAELGTEFYAKELLRFIDGIVAGDAEGRWTRSIGATSPKVFFPIDTLTDGGELESFERGRLKMTYYKLEEGSELKITMPEKHVYIGIMYLMGPKTGWLRLAFHDFRKKRKRLAYDKKSY